MRAAARTAQAVASGASAAAVRVFLAELVDTAAGVDDLLLAGVERMAVGADFDLQIVADRRARRELCCRRCR